MFVVLMNYMKRRKGLYTAVFFSLIIYNLTMLIPTQVVEKLSDAMVSGQLTKPQFLRDMSWLVGSVVLNYLVGQFWGYHLFRAAEDFGADWRKELFRHLVGMRQVFHQKFRSGDVLTRLYDDTDTLTDLLGRGMMSILYSGVLFVLVFVSMLRISWWITLAAMLVLLLMPFCFSILAQLQDKLLEQRRDATATLSSEVLETVEGIRVMRAYVQTGKENSRFESKTAHIKELSDRIARLGSLYFPASTLSIGLSTVVILWLGVHAMEQGQLSMGQVLALHVYLFLLIEPAYQLSDLMSLYQTGRIAFKKLDEWRTETDDMEADGTLSLSGFEEICLSNYSFTYPKAELPSLKGINWVFRRGQTVGIVGKTGAGKTTLIRQFLRQYPLGTGQFLVNGRNFSDYQRKSIESKIAYVPQEHVLFSKTVSENIALAHPDASEETIRQAVACAVFDTDVEQLSDGLQTLVGERGVSLSGGQKQRLSIARALLKEAEVLILDDALSAVDAKTEAQIIQNLQVKRSGQTTLIVSHRLSAVAAADKVLVLEEGRIIEEGTPAELLARKGWYYEQYCHQQEQEEA